jgi:FkbM family methyltransferase
MTESLKTIFGLFAPECKKRLDLTFDYETCAIRSFKRIAQLIKATKIYDIGANIGVYSIYCSDIPNVSEIHAFEPAPAAYDLLNINASLQSKGSGLKIHPVALSSDEGEVNFEIVSPLSGANSIVTRPSKTTRIVKAIPLDKFSTIRGDRVGVKIDVEGHEVSVLRGAEEFFSKNHCYAQIESLRIEAVHEIKSIMNDFGYVHVFSLQNDHLFLHKVLSNYTKSVMEIIAEELAKDLHDLTVLRTTKRKIAYDAKVLWQNAGYRRDPLLEVE